MLDDLIHDLRYGVRTLAQSPGLTLTAIVILMLGIGANTTIFTLVHALFFQPPPQVTDPAQLVRAHRHIEQRPAWWSYPDYVFFRQHQEAFSGLAAYDPDGLVATADLGQGGRASVDVGFVSDNYFDLLGARPAAGRSFHPDECAAPGSGDVAVISHGLWRRSFGQRAQAIGAEVRLNGHPFTVVGVAPAGFRGASPVEVPPDVWVPITIQPVLNPTPYDLLRRVEGSETTWLQVLGRLRDRVGPGAAQANLDALTAALGEQYPGWFHDGQGVQLLADFQYQPQVRDQLLRLSGLLTAVAALVLAIAGANVAILLLARASTRQKELGVRLALGAGRGRIVRQLLVESLLLALVGGGCGFLLSFQTAALAARAMPYRFAVDFSPDLPVLGFSLLATVAAALAFGLAPALQAARTDVLSILKLGDVGSGRSRLRDALVVAQVALSIVLVTGAALFIRSLRAAESVELGYATADRLLVSINLQNHGYDQEAAGIFLGQAVERVAALPGVHRAATTLFVPFRGSWSTSLGSQHGLDLTDDDRLSTRLNAVGPGYFETMAIPILAGRGFTAGDRPDAPRVAVVSTTTAETLWPGRPPLGQTLTHWGPDGDDTLTVVGVARNVEHYELGEAPRPLIYTPTQQSNRGRASLVIHTAGGDPNALARPVRAAIHALDPDIALAGVTTMEETVERVLGPYRVGATLVSLFGALALVLAATGLYGVLGYLVVRRQRIFGIQMALGASRRRIARSVVGRGLALLAIGSAIGIAAAIAASKAVASFLYGISARDPLSYLAVPLVLAAVTVLASALPAWRAARTHPMEALRDD